ncbi:MAG: P-type conjugative transfer ATPase TrbB [Marinomonas sp.]
MSQKHTRLIGKLKSELGSIIIQALEDPSVVEIMLNPDGTLWVEKHGLAMEHVGEMSALNAESLIGTIADTLNTTVTPDSPILEGELPIDGSRFEGLIPPIVGKPTFTIRKKSSVLLTFDDYVNQEVMTENQKASLVDAVLNHKNVLVCGGTGSGKTTFTNAVIDNISEQFESERLVIIEDTVEIQARSKNSVALRTSINVNMMMLLKATMRLRPDRILVGEVRGQEALALLKSWNTGHSGGVATIHANSALAGLIRLEQLVSESSEASSMSMRPLIAEAVDLVVMIKRTGEGRKISELLSVERLDDQGEYVFSYL